MKSERLKQLDSLTVDEEMELVRLQEEAEQLNNQYKSLLQEKKQADAKVKAEKKQEWEESFKKAKKKVQDTDWEDKTRRTAGNISSWAAKFADSIVTAVGSVIQNTEVNLPYLEAKKRQKSTVSFPSSD